MLGMIASAIHDIHSIRLIIDGGTAEPSANPILDVPSLVPLPIRLQDRRIEILGEWPWSLLHSASLTSRHPMSVWKGLCLTAGFNVFSAHPHSEQLAHYVDTLMGYRTGFQPAPAKCRW